MKGLYEEIQEIPAAAKRCLEENKGLSLPTNVPYVGMGSSYFAPLTLVYCGAKIKPRIASEYYYYLAAKKPLGVLISQSGESSETVWNLENFEKVVSITDNPESSLSSAANLQKLVRLKSGDENFSSTKSYVNTLVALYLGLGLDPEPAIEHIARKLQEIDETSRNTAKTLAEYIKTNRVTGFYIIGSGPNYGTARQGALTMSETTKLAWAGMPVAQYDHGPKETADSTVVIILNSHGKDRKRIAALRKVITNSSALVIELKETELPEHLSPFSFITCLNLIMNYLANELDVGQTFTLGGKITTVEDSVK